jgi:hypothetical protein
MKGELERAKKARYIARKTLKYQGLVENGYSSDETEMSTLF